ncbi:MAG: c-type cytochrome [Pseudomonadota bacterium]|jgi:cytochrome c553
MRYHAAALAVALVAATGAVHSQDPNLARNLAATCANCHGTNGKSLGGIEPLAGIAKDTIVQKMKDFKSGAKPATIMHQISKGYSDQQIELIAAYFAAQK